MSVGGGERDPRELNVEDGLALVSRLIHAAIEIYRKRKRNRRDKEADKETEGRKSRDTDDGFGSDGDRRSPR